MASIEDVLAVQAAGCGGVIVGRALYEGRIEIAAAVAAIGGTERRIGVGPATPSPQFPDVAGLPSQVPDTVTIESWATTSMSPRAECRCRSASPDRTS